MTFDCTQYPKIINMGSGYDYRENCLNIDFVSDHKPDLLADVSALDMLPDGYYEEIIAQDILEHLPRNKTVPSLKEWNRILKISGRLRLRLPNVIGLLTLLRNESDLESQLRLLQCLFGSQQYEGDFHYTGFTQLTLTHYLSLTGFTISSLTHNDKWLFDVVAIKTASPRAMGENEVRQFVMETYRSLLGREPDPGGLAYYTEKILTEQMDGAQVKNELLASREYKKK
jgi:hypothetical protein